MINELVAGGSAGAIGIFLGAPLDIVKVRMQTNPDKYNGFQQSIRYIIKSEGFTAFYKGLASPLIAQFGLNSVLFGTNAIVLRILEPNKKKNELGDPSNVFFAGMVGGFTQCCILVPTDRIKCTLQATESNGAGGFKGTFSCIRNIWRAEGVAGFYRGFLSTALREVPAFGTYFATYNYSLSQLDPTCGPSKQPSTVAILISGGLAGSLSWMSIYPIDVIKSNIQVGHGDSYLGKGMIATARELHRRHGWGIFRRGLGVTMLRAFPVNAAVFYFYELFRSHLEFIHQH